MMFLWKMVLVMLYQLGDFVIGICIIAVISMVIDLIMGLFIGDDDE